MNTKYTYKEFFDIELKSGIRADNKEYSELMKAVCDLIKRYDSKSVLEIGCGLGVLGKYVQESGIQYTGIDSNPYHAGYAAYMGVDVIDTCSSFNTLRRKYDFAVSIEVFEHLTEEEIEDYLSSVNADYFLFSSTKEKGDDDKWGHINCKEESEWLKIFAYHGWELIKNVSVPTEWSLLFKREEL